MNGFRRLSLPKAKKNIVTVNIIKRGKGNGELMQVVTIKKKARLSNILNAKIKEQQ
jgi:hypothetical protein